MADRATRPGMSRRAVLAGAAGALTGSALHISVEPAQATPEEMQEAIAKVIGDAKLKQGKITLDIPPLVENGNSVPCTITVDSPMTAADHCKAIHVFNEKNPQPNVISAYFTPRSGRASVSTRVRLSDSQNVTAIAEMSDGSFYTEAVNVIVTIGACLEDAI